MDSQKPLPWVAPACLVATAAMVTALAGCKTADLSSRGANVATSQSAPVDHGYAPDDCKSLGYIVGRGGGSFGGGWISNDQLVEYAMNDLRNKASELGANYIQHDSPQLGEAGDGDGGSITTTATVSGTAYYCESSGNASPRVEAKPARAAPAAAASASDGQDDGAASSRLRGAAGFRFGISAATAEQVCTEAGYEWNTEEESSSCSGSPAELGIPATAQVFFCEEKLCGVTLVGRPEAKKYTLTFNNLYRVLFKKYGRSDDYDRQLDGECRHKFTSCVVEERAGITARWKWEDGSSLALETGHEEELPVLRLTYANPERAEETEPGPAL